MSVTPTTNSGDLDESQLAVNRNEQEPTYLSIEQERSASRTPTMDTFDFDTQFELMSSNSVSDNDDEDVASQSGLKLVIPSTTSYPLTSRWSIDSDRSVFSATSASSATMSQSGSDYSATSASSATLSQSGSEHSRSTCYTPLTPVTSYAPSTSSTPVDGKKVAFSIDTYAPKVFAGDEDEEECVRELKGIMGRMSSLRLSTAA